MLRKHVNNTDVAIQIIHSFFVKEKQLYKLRVRWWNIGQCHEPWDMKTEQTIEVKLENMPNWKPYVWYKDHDASEPTFLTDKEED